MIKTQIIKEGETPIAVIIDYQEYLRLKEIEEDNLDYTSAAEVKETNDSWTTHQELKNKLGL